jgi:hypothetical protein
MRGIQRDAGTMPTLAVDELRVVGSVKRRADPPILLGLKGRNSIAQRETLGERSTEISRALKGRNRDSILVLPLQGNKWFEADQYPGLHPGLSNVAALRQSFPLSPIFVG